MTAHLDDLRLSADIASDAHRAASERRWRLMVEGDDDGAAALGPDIAARADSSIVASGRWVDAVCADVLARRVAKDC